MDYKTEIIVRHYECDSYGHVNNANYLNYLEHARGEYLKAIGFDYKGYMDAGFGLYVIKISITYKSPAFPEESLEISTRVLKRRKASGTFFQVIKRGETTICEAEVSWASVGKDGKMTPIPVEWDVEGLNVCKAE